jgi:uncharacterized circularly permuted ATP-grasp superfamily protein/uncharacterized alpha-E superfamily protein
MLSDLLQIPLPNPGVYNELSSDGIAPRPHWADFIEGLHEMGASELSQRWHRAEQRIRENGVTYNVYSDPRGASHPWRIDAIPLLIPPLEWRYIEAGIVQRAQLLSLLVEDLYGPQNVLTNGDLPAALVFANPSFLRPLAGVLVPSHSYLHLVAIDLARSPDGQWWVLADRTQAPSGAGYAIENRSIVADVLPDLFRMANVLRLAPFFRAEREALSQLAGFDDPRIVLLTPGPFNETYFEHSYLACHLGLTLVQGADLTVRDRRVYLKTVEGLQPVDVILRRVDDSFCDPLELRGDSVLGVAGLVDAVCAGNVKVANALGSGVIETAGIMPFLPSLAKRLLGESLKLPSVATWWCGQDYALNWVLEHLDHVVMKPAFPARGMEPVFGGELASSEKQSFVKRLRSRPYEYVAQEQVALSTAPVWNKGEFSSRSLVLRTYVLNLGDRWVAMPGGLVRVAATDNSVVSMQRGGHSKDAWVLWDEPVDTFALPRLRQEPVELRRASTDVPSRVADNLFWLGRYAERSECIARLLRCGMTRVRQANQTEIACLIRLHSFFGTRHSKLPVGRAISALDLEHEFISLMTDEKRPDSLSSTLAEVYRVGGNVRERLSADMTRLIGQLAAAVKVEEYMLFAEHSALLTGCLEMLSAFSGLERENITRGPGWLFLSLGRRLERAMYSVRQLHAVTELQDENSWPLLDYLLEVWDSSMTYRSRYFTTVQPVSVLDVLMADETNPRSFDFQLSHLADLYAKLPRNLPEDARAIRHALALLRSFSLESLDHPPARSNDDQERSAEWLRLRRSLKELESLLPSWSDNLSSHYFSHARTLPISIGE